MDRKGSSAWQTRSGATRPAERARGHGGKAWQEPQGCDQGTGTLVPLRGGLPAAFCRVPAHQELLLKKLHSKGLRREPPFASEGAEHQSMVPVPRRFHPAPLARTRAFAQWAPPLLLAPPVWSSSASVLPRGGLIGTTIKTGRAASSNKAARRAARRCDSGARSSWAAQ